MPVESVQCQSGESLRERIRPALTGRGGGNRQGMLDD